MERFKKIRDKRPVIIVKIGGRFSENEELLGIFADELYVMRNEYSFIIVHGGGNEVSLLSKKLGQEPLFKDGIRITTPEEMDIVEMVLSGKVNGRVVRKLRARGIDAVGLSGSDGSIFIGESMGNVAGVETRTGNVVKVTSKLLEILLDEGYVPVISSVSTDLEGEGLNINADSVAFSLSENLIPETLIFISDIPGILKEGKIIRELDASGIEKEIASGTITDGMIPKVEAAKEAVKAGVGKIIIGEFRKREDLKLLISGNAGTVID